MADKMPPIAGLVKKNLAPRRLQELIESTKWADDLTHQEAETLSRHVEAHVVRSGSVIVREGDCDPFMCLIVEGRVEIRKEGKVIGSAGPAKTFGEMSMIDGEPRSAEVAAVEETTLVTISGAQFQKMSEDVPRLATKLLLKVSKLMSQRLRQCTGALSECLGAD